MKSAKKAALACCAIAGIALAQSNPPKKVAPAPSAANRKTPAKTTTRPTTTARRYYARQPVRRYYRPTQNQPTADRYREIQDALAARGYLKTPSTGVWDKDSVDAMQRFQQDQKLDPTGKLTAKSLNALGLGPKTAAPADPPAESAKPATEAQPMQ